MSEMTIMQGYNEQMVIAGVVTVDLQGAPHIFPLVEKTRLKDIQDKDTHITIGDKLIIPSKLYQNVMPCNKQMYNELINEQHAVMSGDNI